MAPENPCKFQRFICILQCTLCPIFMRTTAETHTSLLSLVPINTLFIIRGFGSDKYSDACMYVFVCVCVCVCVYEYIYIYIYIYIYNTKKSLKPGLNSIIWSQSWISNLHKVMSSVNTASDTLFETKWWVRGSRNPQTPSFIKEKWTYVVYAQTILLD